MVRSVKVNSYSRKTGKVSQYVRKGRPVGKKIKLVRVKKYPKYRIIDSSGHILGYKN